MRTNFKMENQNITMVRGDTLSFNVQIIDENGDPMAVDTAYFTCRKKATGGEDVFRKSLGSGIVQENMLMTVRVAPEDTQNIDEGQYFYDFNVGIGDDVFTIMIGTLSIEHDVS